MTDEQMKTHYTFLRETLEFSKWNVDELMNDCHNRENEFLEFKATLFAENAMDRKSDEQNDDFTWHIIKAILAFANGTGGCILLGVDDNGKPVELLDKDTHQPVSENMDKYIKECKRKTFWEKDIFAETI